MYCLRKRTVLRGPVRSLLRKAGGGVLMPGWRVSRKRSSKAFIPTLTTTTISDCPKNLTVQREILFLRQNLGNRGDT